MTDQQEYVVDSPSRGASADGARRDAVRRWSVAASAVVGIAVAFLGSGSVVGTPVNEVAGGTFSSTATLVAPAGPAFAIWGVIYTGLAVLAVLQVLPSRRADARQREVGWLVAASLIVNAAWVAVVQAAWVFASVVVILALLVVLVVALVRLSRSVPSSRAEAVFVDGTMGLYLGWVCIATVANTAAALAYAGVPATGNVATAWSVAVLAVAGAVGVLLAVGLRGRLAPAVGLAWGLAWVAVARSVDEPRSTATAVAAAVAAAVTVGAAVAVRTKRR